MTREPTEEELALVARHGRGALDRALATVQLAKRKGREDELRRIVEDVIDSETVVSEDN